MNPFIKKALGSVLGVVATATVTWLISKGWLTSDQGVQVIAVLTSVGLIAVQRVWKQNKNAQELLTAQATSEPSTAEENKAMVKDGQAPSVMTPADVVPRLKPATDKPGG